MFSLKSYDKDFYYTREQLLIRIVCLEREIKDIKNELLCIQEMLTWRPDNEYAIKMLKEHYESLNNIYKEM